MKFHFIDTGFNNAFMNMAIDEALMHCNDSAILRVYGWKPAGISLGYFQDAVKEINIKACRKNKVDVVRRLTGGKAVLHDRELTYSFVCPENFLSKDIVESYKIISQGILQCFLSLGLKVELKKEKAEKTDTAICFHEPNFYEVVLDGRKMVGSAQVRKFGKILQHGSVPLDFNFEKMCSLFNVDNLAKVVEKTKKSVSCINDELAKIGKKEIDYAVLGEKMKKGFEKAFDAEFVSRGLSAEEKKMAEKLYKERYCSDEWNLNREFRK